MPGQGLGRLEDVIAVGADQLRLHVEGVVQRVRDAEQVLRLGQHVGLQLRLNSIEIAHLVLRKENDGDFVWLQFM